MKPGRRWAAKASAINSHRRIFRLAHVCGRSQARYLHAARTSYSSGSNVSVIGVGYGEYVNRKPGSQSVFEYGVAELVKAGLRPPPPIRFPLSEGRAALQTLADGGVLGKVVLEP